MCNRCLRLKMRQTELLITSYLTLPCGYPPFPSLLNLGKRHHYWPRFLTEVLGGILDDFLSFNPQSNQLEVLLTLLLLNISNPFSSQSSLPLFSINHHHLSSASLQKPPNWSTAFIYAPLLNFLNVSESFTCLLFSLLNVIIEKCQTYSKVERIVQWIQIQ